MTLDVHIADGSPPCGTVLFAAAALGLKPNLIQVDFMKGEHLSAEYLKINPQHTVPTLVDDGFALNESRAIVRYLFNKYGADSSLYPKDPQARAVVEQRLDFDLGTLYQKFADYYYPQIYGNKPGDDAFKKLQDALGSLNMYLGRSKYAAGDELTIADYCLLSTVATIDVSYISFKDYPNIQKWFDLVKSNVSHYDIIEEGLVHYKAYIDARKA